ncbi:chloride channel protein 2-like isoform X2 [Mytilus californianus]|uniref:chloride channel protein 2-like isoform X2 n=1 Tax=Mytilus californianus TaxID=6549 RepID=UPI002245AF0C|nr:chloride channel protein 2-like isoform X2 [Mytilus californianus]
MADNKRKTEQTQHEQNFGYEETLIYGQYKRDLGSFAKFQAKKFKDQKDLGKTEIVKSKSRLGLYIILDNVVRVRDVVFKSIGEDWVFLALLGVLMALLSFAMDYIIEKCQSAKMWLYTELAFSLPLQYFAWISYTILFILFATGFTHLVSPQAVGSGIPEMKTILRGVVLKEFLTFKTLIAKVVGLCASLGSTLTLGKEGPFVHIASIVATLLGKLSSFKGVYQNESRRTEMLAAACAVGVAGTFAAPIGGVLFSIEVTATYFAVRNYWRGFFAAVCGAITFRLLAIWFQHEETITALFKTNLRTEYPFDALELVAYSFIGVICGFAGALFILLHRKIILFTRKRRRLTNFLQKNRFIYPGMVAFVISSLTFPPGFGQFFAGMLTNKQAINELFSNITWTIGQADDLEDEKILSHWIHPDTNVYVTLVLFIIMHFLFGAICNTLPIPAGVFVPVFMVGAGFGRLIGEAMAAWFPLGLAAAGLVHKIVPGGYAITGAASLAGSVTRTISTSVIVFELTGQISHVLPVVVSVLIANAVSNKLQPSFFDSIIRLKKLPYLPDIVSAKGKFCTRTRGLLKKSAWNIFIEDIMVKDVKYITLISTYKDLQDLLSDTVHKTYPFVDSPDSMILLGSVQRYELERIIYVQLSYDQKIVPQGSLDDLSDDELSETSAPNSRSASRPTTPPPFIDSQFRALTPKSRFHVSKVDDIPLHPVHGRKLSLSSADDHLIIPQIIIQHSEDNLTAEERDIRQYHTIQVPLRGILKKSTSASRLPIKSGSATDLKAEINAYYRKLAGTRKESIVEDVPFFINKSSFSNLPGLEKRRKKKVKLPPEPVKISNLPEDKQKEWEEEKLLETIEWEGCQIDPAPFQLVERTSLHKVHSLFSLLGLSRAYVTNTGKLCGVCGLQELRNAIQGRIDAEEAIKKREEESEDKEFDPQELEVEVAPHPSDFMLSHSNDADFEYPVVQISPPDEDSNV